MKIRTGGSWGRQSERRGLGRRRPGESARAGQWAAEGQPAFPGSVGSLEALAEQERLLLLGLMAWLGLHWAALSLLPCLQRLLTELLLQRKKRRLESPVSVGVDTASLCLEDTKTLNATLSTSYFAQ